MKGAKTECAFVIDIDQPVEMFRKKTKTTWILAGQSGEGDASGFVPVKTWRDSGPLVDKERSFHFYYYYYNYNLHRWNEKLLRSPKVYAYRGARMEAFSCDRFLVSVFFHSFSLGPSFITLLPAIEILGSNNNTAQYRISVCPHPLFFFLSWSLFSCYFRFYLILGLTRSSEKLKSCYFSDPLVSPPLINSLFFNWKTQTEVSWIWMDRIEFSKRKSNHKLMKLILTKRRFSHDLHQSRHQQKSIRQHVTGWKREMSSSQKWYKTCSFRNVVG